MSAGGSITSLPEAVAALGALPVPVVPEPRTLDVVEHELTGARLSLYEEELENARLRLALKSAQRGRSRLRARVAELEAERHSTNEALDDVVQALRADAAMVCRVCEAPVRWVDSPTGGWWNYVTPAEAGDGHGITPKPVFVPQTERSRWVAIADALNAAHAAGMPVGIDMDGTLTDHNAWSVVWDRAAERWTVAGYEDGFPALDEASRKSFAERADRETNPGRRAAWRMLAQDVTDGEHYAQVHHTYKVGHDLPELGGTQ